jgi:hypothetical protein
MGLAVVNAELSTKSPHYQLKRQRVYVGVLSDRNQAIESVLEGFLQEIVEGLPPDEHGMGTGYDRIDMLDVQLT